jgi:imidazolonepropionase-like amidohydrolase
MNNYLLPIIFTHLLNLLLADPIVVRYENGHWFNGEQFEQKVLYSVDGIFAEKTNLQIDTTIDLKSGYVIPPFGDAHTHNLSDTTDLDEMAQKYVADGVFYVQVLNNYASKVDFLRQRFESSSTIDVAYANGGLTATLGHPFVAYVTSTLGLHWSAIFSQSDKILQSRAGENDAYWFMDSLEAVDEKWPLILATRPNFIKIYLINTENQQELFDNQQMGRFGLSRDVAEAIVRKAKEHNLRVIAHIENAYDFNVGLDIQVDGFAHLPGYSWNGMGSVDAFIVSDEDIKRAADQQVFLTPTGNIAQNYATNYDSLGNRSIDSIRMQRINEFLTTQIDRFMSFGVNLVVGSDQLLETSVVEADYLVNTLNAVDPRTAIRMLSVTTPQTIFPNRKVGKFEDGFEASFLVLENNPLENWDNSKSIFMRVKQGKILDANIVK